MHSDKLAILSLRSTVNIEPVTVAGLELPVHVRGLTGRERDSFENACFQQRGKQRVLSTENIRAKLLVRSICDDKGVRLFQDSDEAELGGLPAQTLDMLFTIAQKLSGLGATDVEELQED